MWVVAILGAVVIAAGGCGAAYLLLFRDSGLLRDRPGVFVPAPTTPTAAAELVESAQPTLESTATVDPTGSSNNHKATVSARPPMRSTQLKRMIKQAILMCFIFPFSISDRMVYSD